MEYTYELYHYGVKGMKWGIRRYQNADGSLTEAGRRRDKRLEDRIERFSYEAGRHAEYASMNARQRVNGSSNLSRSDRYIKKAEKAAKRMTDKEAGKAWLESETYKEAVYKRQEAGKDYVKRTAGERVATLAATTAASAGMVFVSAAAGLPYTMIYLSFGPEYKLREDRNG